MDTFFECCGQPTDTSTKDHEDYHKMNGLAEVEKKQPIELTYEEEADLEDMFKEQASFQHHFYNPDLMTFEEKVALSKEYILSAHCELSEVLNTLPWKTHRKYDKDHFDYFELRGELIDVVKFLFNVYYIWGISSSDLICDFYEKSAKVKQRFEEERPVTKTID